MMIGNNKEEGRICSDLLHVLEKALTPWENRLTAILNWKKPKPYLGFEPGLPRQNAIALPLAPLPLPIFKWNNHKWKKILSLERLWLWTKAVRSRGVMMANKDQWPCKATKKCLKFGIWNFFHFTKIQLQIFFLIFLNKKFHILSLKPWLQKIPPKVLI